MKNKFIVMFIVFCALALSAKEGMHRVNDLTPLHRQGDAGIRI